LPDEFMNFTFKTRVLAFLAILMAGTQLCLGQQPAAPTGQASAVSANQPANGDTQFQSRSPRYKIAPGDTFDINFDLSPEFNQAAVQVQPDGFVTLRAVGDVKVQGQTVPELRS
jgi:protein involved in polysaccharide export with SLBB domain